MEAVAQAGFPLQGPDSRLVGDESTPSAMALPQAVIGKKGSSVHSTTIVPAIFSKHGKRGYRDRTYLSGTFSLGAWSGGAALFVFAWIGRSIATAEASTHQWA